MNDEMLPGFDVVESSQEQVIFDYRLLSAEKREFVLQKTDETQWLLKKTAENIIKIGKNLQDVQDVLPHGAFGPWLQSEFGLSHQSAYNFMHVADRFEGKIKNFLNLSSSVLYLLAAPSTPQKSVDEVLQRAESGERITRALTKRIIEEQQAREKAEENEARSRAEIALVQEQLSFFQEQSQSRVTDLMQQIETLQEEKKTLIIPPTEYVDKVVWPEEKANELKRLQEELDELNISLEAEKEVIPQETQVQMQNLQIKLDKLEKAHRQLEDASKADQTRIQNLDGQLKVAIRDRITSENDERIRQEWRTINSETRSCLMRLLGQWPTSLDIKSFESDDWERLSQLKSTLRRVLEECDNLNFDGDDMIVDDFESPVSYIEAGDHYAN